MTQEKLIIPEDVREHLQMNCCTESYRYLPGAYEERDGKWGHYIHWDKIQERHIKMAQNNLAILKDRIEQYDKIEGPRVGDYLELPFGMFTRFTHAWDDGIQIGGGSGSYYLGNGHISYSGGLDPSIEYEFLKPTDKKKDGMVWFFHENSAGGGRGVHFYMPFRVFTLAPEYDVDKIWIVQRKKKELYRNQAETITRVSGNGQEYTLPLPELHIIGELTDEIMATVERLSGLKFNKTWHNGYWVQPLKHSEYNAVRLAYEFEETYYNNATHHNCLFLKFIKGESDRRRTRALINH